MELSGVTYYKLNPKIHGYDGDTKKNCGLTGGEVDANFNFLRGMDIKEGYWDDENKILTLERFNGDTIDISGITFEIITSGSTASTECIEYDDTYIKCQIDNLDKKLDAFIEYVNDRISGLTEDVNSQIEAIKDEIKDTKINNFVEVVNELQNEIETIHSDLVTKLVVHENKINKINKLINNG